MIIYFVKTYKMIFVYLYKQVITGKVILHGIQSIKTLPLMLLPPLPNTKKKGHFLPITHKLTAFINQMTKRY